MIIDILIIVGFMSIGIIVASLLIILPFPVLGMIITSFLVFNTEFISLMAHTSDFPKGKADVIKTIFLFISF